MKPNITKIANAILFMIENKVQNLNDKKLYSLLFLIEHNHLETCGQKIFNETFIKNSRNVDPKTVSEIFDIIANNEDLDEEDERLYIIQELLDHIDIEILKKEKYIELKFIKMEEGFDSSLFTKDEFKTLDKLVNKYNNETPRKLANICFSIEKVRQTINGDVII